MQKPGTQVKEKGTEARHSPSQVRKQGRQAGKLEKHIYARKEGSKLGRKAGKQKEASTCTSPIGR